MLKISTTVLLMALFSIGRVSWAADSGGAESLDIVTRVVGEVGPRVVTSREVAMSEAIAQVLSGLPLGKDKSVIKPADPTFAGQVVRVLESGRCF